MKGLNQTFIGQMGTNTAPWDPDGAIETFQENILFFFNQNQIRHEMLKVLTPFGVLDCREKKLLINILV